MSKNQERSDWMRVKDAEKYLGLSQASVFRMIKDGRLKRAKTEGITFVDVGAFEEMLEALANEQAE